MGFPSEAPYCLVVTVSARFFTKAVKNGYSKCFVAREGDSAMLKFHEWWDGLPDDCWTKSSNAVVHVFWGIDVTRDVILDPAELQRMIQQTEREMNGD